MSKRSMGSILKRRVLLAVMLMAFGAVVAYGLVNGGPRATKPEPAEVAPAPLPTTEPSPTPKL